MWSRRRRSTFLRPSVKALAEHKSAQDGQWSYMGIAPPCKAQSCEPAPLIQRQNAQLLDHLEHKWPMLQQAAIPIGYA